MSDMDENLGLIKSEYGLDGIQQVSGKLKNGNGKFTSIFQGDEAPRTIILWNCESDSQAKVNSCSISLTKANAEYMAGHVVIDCRHTEKIKTEINLLPSLLRAIFLSNHSVGKYKTENNKDRKAIEDIFIISSTDRKEEFKMQFDRAHAAAETIKSCMALVNEPANHKRPQKMADWMLQSGQQHGFDVEVLNKAMLEEKGFHALLAVNRGSEDPACCIIAKYLKGDDSIPTICLVGKGVTFDTGGMSVKPSQNMHYMKSDMGGAAAVMGTMELVAKLHLPVNVIGVIPCTDNSVDSLATKPGDVIKSYKGSTIEIIDTDAEGRLILADGLSYAVQQFNPDFLVDLATLTGSVVRTLGSHAAGLMTNSEAMADSLLEAGSASGDRVWRLPLWDDYDQYMASDIADIRNLSTKPVAGAITAGKFLEHFTDDHKNWAHLDIAGTAFGTSPFSKGYSASGFGILLLLNWIELISKK